MEKIETYFTVFLWCGKWGENMKSKKIYIVIIVVLLIVLGCFANTVLSFKSKVNTTMRLNVYYATRLFCDLMEDYNADIISADDDIEKYDAIVRLRSRLYSLSAIMDYTYYDKNISSLIEPYYYYLAGLKDDQLNKDTEYLNDVIDKNEKVYIISQKISKISLDEISADDGGMNRNFKVAPKVISYFKEINSTVEDVK